MKFKLVTICFLFSSYNLVHASQLGPLVHFLSKGVDTDLQQGCPKADINNEEALNYAQAAWDKYRPIKCKKSKAPLFDKDTEEPIKIEIQADWNAINNQYYANWGNVDPGRQQKIQGSRAYREAVVTYTKPDGEKQIIGAQVSNRGVSRSKWCSDQKPFRLSFVEQYMYQGILENVKDRDNPQSELLQNLKSIEGIRSSQLNGGKQDDNIFDKVGDDIKVISHCGQSETMDARKIGGIGKDEQDSRLLREYYAYKAQEPFKTVVTTAKLALITYKDLSGKVINTRYAIFREPPGAMAKRCKMEHVEEFDNKHPEAADQFELFTRMMGQYDHRELMKNIDFVNDKDGKQWYTYYDYDRAPWVKPPFDGEKNYTPFKNEFKEFLDKQKDNESFIVKAFFALTKKDKVLNTYKDSNELDARAKEDMDKWFLINFQLLEDYLASQTGKSKDLVDGLYQMQELKNLKNDEQIIFN